MILHNPPLAGADDFSIPKCFAGADDAIAVIREHHAKWLTGNEAG
jgi:hypothetical protein